MKVGLNVSFSGTSFNLPAGASLLLGTFLKLILCLRKVTSHRLAPAYRFDICGFIYIYRIIE